MRILILDDDRDYNDPQNLEKAGLIRIRAFKQKFIGHDVVWVQTATEAIAALSGQDWDALFLDHDLGGESFVDSGPGTGYEVAKWLEDHPDRKPPQIFIHSLNPIGSINIQAALPEAILAPGAWKCAK